MIWRVLCIMACLSLAAEVATAQERWSGGWAQSGGAQGGKLDFLFTPDGRINGNITNGALVGLWSGFIRDDGVMFATYEYPQLAGFAAHAIGRILQQQGHRVVGHLVFVRNKQVFAEGHLQLTRSFVSPQQANPRAPEYPFTGNGLYVYCAAPSVCGQRGINALPGNWGWTSGLFSDIKRQYPQVWCNLYPGSCARR